MISQVTNQRSEKTLFRLQYLWWMDDWLCFMRIIHGKQVSIFLFCWWCHAKWYTNTEVTFTVAQNICEISWMKSTHDNRIRYCSYLGWSNEFAALTNRMLLGLKVNSAWAVLHTLLHYRQWTIFACNISLTWTHF